MNKQEGDLEQKAEGDDAAFVKELETAGIEVPQIPLEDPASPQSVNPETAKSREAQNDADLAGARAELENAFKESTETGGAQDYETFKNDFAKLLQEGDEGAIEKARWKFQMQYHPDRNPGDQQAEERFKELRRMYDNRKNGKSDAPSKPEAGFAPSPNPEKTDPIQKFAEALNAYAEEGLKNNPYLQKQRQRLDGLWKKFSEVSKLGVSGYETWLKTAGDEELQREIKRVNFLVMLGNLCKEKKIQPNWDVLANAETSELIGMVNSKKIDKKYL